MGAWTGGWTLYIRAPAAYNRIRSEDPFAIAGVGLDFHFVLVEETLCLLA